jgi:hypothetical protein
MKKKSGWDFFSIFAFYDRFCCRKYAFGIVDLPLMKNLPWKGEVQFQPILPIMRLLIYS